MGKGDDRQRQMRASRAGIPSQAKLREKVRFSVQINRDRERLTEWGRQGRTTDSDLSYRQVSMGLVSRVPGRLGGLF
jgi:hypothetical protein